MKVLPYINDKTQTLFNVARVYDLFSLDFINYRGDRLRLKDFIKQESSEIHLLINKFMDGGISVQGLLSNIIDSEKFINSLIGHTNISLLGEEYSDIVLGSPVFYRQFLYDFVKIKQDYINVYIYSYGPQDKADAICNLRVLTESNFKYFNLNKKYANPSLDFKKLILDHYEYDIFTGLYSIKKDFEFNVFDKDSYNYIGNNYIFIYPKKEKVIEDAIVFKENVLFSFSFEKPDFFKKVNLLTSESSIKPFNLNDL